VIYLSGEQPGWDQRSDWFPRGHAYRAMALRSWQRARPGRSPVTLPRGLGRALRGAAPACVVSWEYGPATLRALAWCRKRRLPLLVFSELTPHSDAALPPGRVRFHRRLASRVDGFVAAGSSARERLVGMGVRPELVEVSLQSADVEAFRRAAATRKRRDGPVRVLSVGRLVPDKNLGRLLRAFAEAGIAEEARLELVGTGPLEDELRAEARRLGVPASFRGYLGPAELPEAYAGADVLALVSTYEPFGVTVREGVAAGLPIVCTRAAGASADLALDNATLVDPGRDDQIAAALRRLVRDRAERERMASASRALAERTPLSADAEAFERAVLGAIERWGQAGDQPPSSAGRTSSRTERSAASGR